MTAKVLYVPSCFFVGAKFMEDRYIGDVTCHDSTHVRTESEPSRDRERQGTRLRMFRTWFAIVRMKQLFTLLEALFCCITSVMQMSRKVEYCLKNEQECIIRFKTSRRSREFF